MKLARLSDSQLSLAIFLQMCSLADKSRQDIVKRVNAGPIKDKEGNVIGDFRARIDEQGARKARDVNWLNSQIKLLVKALENVANGGTEKERTVVKDQTTNTEEVTYKEVKVDSWKNAQHPQLKQIAEKAPELVKHAKKFYVKGQRGKSVKIDAAKIARAFQNAGALDF